MIIIDLLAFFFALTTIDAQCTEGHATCTFDSLRTNLETPSPPDVTNHPNLHLLYPMCGPITLRVTGGNKTGVSEFPWMAQLLYHIKYNQTNPEFYCTGTIISSQYILTAAHCVTQLPSNCRLIGVRVGDHDVSTERDCDKDENGQELECAEKYQEFDVESIHYHPEYSITLQHNDIALIRLNFTINFKPLNVRPICLPYGTAANLNEKRISHLITSGWGRVPFGLESQILLQEKLSLIPHEKCKEIYKPFNKTISYKQLCAGSLKYINLCVGDSGGPLQAPGIYNDRSARIIQYGVTSYRLLCNSPYPEVYTNIAYYMDWILDTMTAQCTEERATCINSTQQPTTTTMTSMITTETDLDALLESNEFGIPLDVTNHPNLRLLDPQCGLISQPKIYGGNKTGIFEFPWMALIAYNVSGRSNSEFRCSGTIISSRYVLTAATCVTSLPRHMRVLGVRIGDHDISKNRDCIEDENGVELECAETYQDILAESVHYHPQFSTRKMQNDIALIRLNFTIDFRPLNVKSICLPYGSAANLIHKKAVATGWGSTEFGQRSRDLLKARLPIVPNEQCKELYKWTTEIWHKQLCAGGEESIDTCMGDSGGPLQAFGIYNNRSVRMIQYGIVSYGLKQCGIGSFPGVYTNVVSYMDWILNTITD